MIDAREGQETHRRTFAELVAHFKGEVFVILELYADESGTHHPQGLEPNSEVPVVAGYMALRQEWERSDRDWAAVLASYGVSVFHAKEFDNRWAPYAVWGEERREAFKYELAEIAGRHIPVGGGYHNKEHFNRHPNDQNYAYGYAINHFFSDLFDSLREREGDGYLRNQISIIFDMKTDRQWDSAIREAVDAYKQKGVDITEYAYGDDKKHLPLQMADLYASQTRKLTKLNLDAQIQRNGETRLKSTTYDIILNRNMRPNRRWRPAFTPETLDEMWELSAKYPAVKRALDENTCCHFEMRNQARIRQNRV